MRTARTVKTAAFLIALATALPAAAQTDNFTLRPYGMITEQAFSAKTTFNGIFGQSAQPFWGAGAELILKNNIYIDVSASRFKKTGGRALLLNGQISRPNIPLAVVETPLEFSGGYRFRLRRYPRVIPFAGAGVGWYGYSETTKCPTDNPNCVLSSFVDPSENVDTHHVGELVVGGVEVRVHRWIALSIDAQYTHIPGVIGSAGLSKDAGESDLGGIAGRFKVIVGR
jgi:hypothetical protein